MNYAYASSFHGVGPDTLQDVTNGQYLLGLEAVNPTGESFDPQIMDTVTFTIVGNPELCAPGGLVAYAGDGRNVLSWNEPFSTMFRGRDWLIFIKYQPNPSTKHRIEC